MAIGERFLAFPQLHELDAALGVDSEGEQLLPGDELVERARTLLAAAARFARQLPRGHYDDPTPGSDASGPLILPDGTEVRLPDGTPYMPHATSLGLVRHIVGHGAKALLLVEDPGADAVANAATFGPFGEPAAGVPMEGILAEIERLRAGLAARRPDLGRLIVTYMGEKTVHQVIGANTYSLAQHTRQLESILRSLGLEPDRALGEADYEGLGLPEAVWE